MKKQLLLVEDQTLVRKSLTALINTSEDFEVVDSAETISQAIPLLAQHQTLDLILCDYSLRGETALDFLQAIKDKNKTPVILLTSFFNARHLQACINHGAKGFLFKECDMEELEEAFHTVIAGGTCFKIVESIKESHPKLNQSDRSQNDFLRLTPKEEETLRWLATGMSNKEIAKVLNKSDQTVKSQVSELLRKLKVSSRTEAVTKATQLNII